MGHLFDEEIAIGKESLGAFMEPWQGALSSLYSAASKESLGGHMYEPEDGGLRGYPILATVGENAMDEAVGKKLWDTAQTIRGIVYPR